MWLAFKRVEIREMPSSEDQLLTNSKKQKTNSRPSVATKFISVDWLLRVSVL